MVKNTELKEVQWSYRWDIEVMQFSYCWEYWPWLVTFSQWCMALAALSALEAALILKVPLKSNMQWRDARYWCDFRRVPVKVLALVFWIATREKEMLLFAARMLQQRCCPCLDSRDGVCSTRCEPEKPCCPPPSPWSFYCRMRPEGKALVTRDQTVWLICL